jgi:PAS domain S-box-containing protein
MTPFSAVAMASGLFEQASSSVLRATREAIVMIDEAQTVVAINPAAETLLGCKAASVLGTTLERFVPEQWRARHATQVRHFAASHSTQRAMAHGRRIELLRADGRPVPVEIALTRIEMAGPGEPRVYFAAMLRDASDDRTLEEKIATLERRMRAVFELSPTAIWICEDDRLVYGNRAAARLFGVPSIDSLIERSVCDMLDRDSRKALRAEMDRALSRQETGAVVAGRLKRPDGQTREVEIALAALPDHGHRTVQMVVNDVTERRREASELERSRRSLRDLSANVVEAREEERRRIARELHDELGQRLTALKIDLAGLVSAAKWASDDERVAGMQAMLDDTLASVRRIASDLRPLMLDDLGPAAAIEWLARDASQRMGIPVHARLPVTELAVDQRVAIALYRMVQEALTNVARHARARSVEVDLRIEGDRLVLTVSDDGTGLAPDAMDRSGSFGLMGLRERAHMLGGEIEIAPRPGGGTRLVARLPATPVPPGERPA